MSVSAADLYRDFRPRRARRVAYALATVQLVVMSVVAAAVPGAGPIGFEWYDRAGMVAISVAIAVVLWRFGQVSARPAADGLEVRNLLYRTRLAWAEVVAVHFGDGAPWVVLDLADGETLAVMAVQRSDGPPSRAEAERLSTLVALNSRTSGAD